MLRSTRKRWAIGLALLMLMALMPLAALPQATAAPLQQGNETWVELGTSAQRVFNRAVAYSSADNSLYVYGGLDTNSQEDNLGEQIDFSSGLMSVRARRQNMNAPEVWGSVGAYRPPSSAMTDTGDSGTVYFIGGMDTGLTDSRGASRADSQDDVIELDVNSGSSRTIRPAGSFPKRALAAAAYSPKHNTIVVQGGTERCVLSVASSPTPTVTMLADTFGTLTDVDCQAGDTRNDTMFLTFDSSGNATWSQGPNGGPQRMMHAAAYDTMANKLYIYGGTRDASRTENSLHVLDMSGDDLSAASWSSVSAGGSGPGGVALHGMAYDAKNNRIIAYGGVRSNPLADNENTAGSTTYMLDLSQDPPVWSSMRGASAGTIVSPLMAYNSSDEVVVMYGGRNKWNERRQTIHSTIYALMVEEVEPTDVPPTAGPPTDVPPPGESPAPPEATDVPIDPTNVCQSAIGKVPAAVIAAAQANPNMVAGFGQRCNPNLAPGPLNPPRTWLGLRSPSLPFHPLFNSLTWKCGCP